MEKEENGKKRTTRLLVTLGEALHFEIKKRALFRNQTMSNWIKSAIWDRLKEEDRRQ